MKKILTAIILLVLMTSFSFAETLTFLGTSTTVPAVLQGNWTETAVSRNSGGTWINGLSISIKITKTAFIVGDAQWTISNINSYSNEQEMKGYLLKTIEGEEFFEFWFEDDNNVILLIHKDRIEIARCRLER